MRFFRISYKGVGITNHIAVYDNIRRKAKEAGISINSIEKQTGLSIGSICKWNIVSPTASSLMKVANVLGVTVDELLEKDTA